MKPYAVTTDNRDLTEVERELRATVVALRDRIRYLEAILTEHDFAFFQGEKHGD